MLSRSWSPLGGVCPSASRHSFDAPAPRKTITRPDLTASVSTNGKSSFLAFDVRTDIAPPVSHYPRCSHARAIISTFPLWVGSGLPPRSQERCLYGGPSAASARPDGYAASATRSIPGIATTRAGCGTEASRPASDGRDPRDDLAALPSP